MSSLIDKGKIADKISDLFLDNYPNPSKELETFYKEVLKIVVNEKGQSNWISVKERLPEPSEKVLTYGVNTVTHWTYLPESPESEDDEK